MRSIRRARGVVAALVAVLALTVGAGGASAATQPQEPDPGCFWGSVINASTLNLGFPNGMLTNYWYDKFTLPAGAKVVFRGRYPDARYMSFNSYFSSPSDPALRGIATDALYDAQIAPDPGSTNPFLPGAKRTPDKKHRSWTATVSGDRPPADPGQREANTLYAGTLASGQAQPVEILYRVYTPDKNADLAGDGGLPQATVVLADGTTLTGRAACDAVGVDTAPLEPNTLPLNQYVALTHLPPHPGLGAPGSSPTAPAVNPGRWYRPVNQCHFQDPFFQAAGYPAPACPNTPALTQWPTKDNAYIAAYVDRSFGPAPGGHNVAVMTGRMPTTPATGKAPFMAAGKQMRFWGVCMNESLATTQVTVTDGCAYDEQIPVDAQGNYRVVISTPEDRPANATAKCGVTWLNWGDGDGAPAPYGRPTSGLLIVRNLLPDASFAEAAQNIPAPGLPAQVAATMGSYMPTLAYQSPAEFQAGGCGR
jgi:hypothetical protein